MFLELKSPPLFDSDKLYQVPVTSRTKSSMGNDQEDLAEMHTETMALTIDRPDQRSTRNGL